MYLSPFIFLFFTKINTTLPEHSPKCGNSSNNPASCSYLVIDKHTEKCHLANNHNIQGWKPPFCTPRPSVSQCNSFCFFFSRLYWSFSYKAVLQIDLIPLWQEIQAERYFLGLFHWAGSSPFVVPALHVLIGFGCWWSLLDTVGAWSFLWLHLLIHTTWTCWSEGKVLQK